LHTAIYSASFLIIRSRQKGGSETGYSAWLLEDVTGLGSNSLLPWPLGSISEQGSWAEPHAIGDSLMSGEALLE
jgi:hypothetical protein